MHHSSGIMSMVATVAATTVGGLALSTEPAPAASAGFYLHDGDSVVMLGDSITDQCFYTMYVETYVTTRFPQLKITWTPAGWSGDSVRVATNRLDRDVIPYQPTVLTVMLGMNDAGYKEFDRKLFDTYTSGYATMLKTVRAACPSVRYTLLVPSPFDEINGGQKCPGGYNAVLLRYGQSLLPLVASTGGLLADFNAPMTAMLQKAHDKDAKIAKQIIPDQVHPSAAGHLVMAESLLKAWNAPALVSAVVLDAAAKTQVKADNTQISRLTFHDRIEWNQMDKALPMPYSQDKNDAVTALVIASCDFVQSLDQETLQVTGLAAGNYEFFIDAQPEGHFSSEQLTEGLNLATMFTPMSWQARQVQTLVRSRQAWHAASYQGIISPLLQDYDAFSSWNAGEEGRARRKAFYQTMLATDQVMLEMERTAAVPVLHHYSLIPVK